MRNGVIGMNTIKDHRKESSSDRRAEPRDIRGHGSYHGRTGLLLLRSITMKPILLVVLVPVAFILISACGQPAWTKRAAPRSDVTGPGTPVTLRGKPMSLVGSNLAVGDRMPDVAVRSMRGGKVKLSSLTDKITLLCVVPAIDTPVCTSTALELHDLQHRLGDDVNMAIISTDTPGEQQTWCDTNSVQDVMFVSDEPDGFGKSWGLKMSGSDVLARAVFVIDRKGVIRYIETVGENTYSPNMAAAVDVVERLRNPKPAPAK